MLRQGLRHHRPDALRCAGYNGHFSCESTPCFPPVVEFDSRMRATRASSGPIVAQIVLEVVWHPVDQAGLEVRQRFDPREPLFHVWQLPRSHMPRMDIIASRLT